MPVLVKPGQYFHRTIDNGGIDVTKTYILGYEEEYRDINPELHTIASVDQCDCGTSPEFKCAHGILKQIPLNNSLRGYVDGSIHRAVQFDNEGENYWVKNPVFLTPEDLI